jgi:hypothetical protein
MPKGPPKDMTTQRVSDLAHVLEDFVPRPRSGVHGGAFDTAGAEALDELKAIAIWGITDRVDLRNDQQFRCPVCGHYKFKHVLCPYACEEETDS